MEIKPLSNNPYYSKEVNLKKNKEVSEEAKKDKLEISEEAKIMQQSTLDSKKIEEIKKRLTAKFYDSDEVINRVADAILKELNQQ